LQDHLIGLCSFELRLRGHLKAHDGKVEGVGGRGPDAAITGFNQVTANRGPNERWLWDTSEEHPLQEGWGQSGDLWEIRGRRTSVHDEDRNLYVILGTGPGAAGLAVYLDQGSYGAEVGHGPRGNEAFAARDR
jgi:hypothetical protein